MSKIKIVTRRYGGKSYLAKWIVSNFPEHRTYIEPFCGAASVLFAKPMSQAEIINDLDGLLMNVYRQIRSHPKELAALVWATPYAQDNWRDSMGETELEQAALYMAKTVQYYAGSTSTSTFSIDMGNVNKNKAHVWADWFQRILPAAARLKDVQIVNRDAIDLIDRAANRKDTLYYVDPPYVGHEREYSYHVDYEKLASTLKSVAGKVVVSGYKADGAYWDGWRTETKDYKVRALTGRHKKKALDRVEYLYMNW